MGRPIDEVKRRVDSGRELTGAKPPFFVQVRQAVRNT
jgi:hypothetical protein